LRSNLSGEKRGAGRHPATPGLAPEECAKVSSTYRVLARKAFILSVIEVLKLAGWEWRRHR
jgi:hypothetical protein